MADKSTYLENQDDQISAQKRMEQEGISLSGAIKTVGLVTAFVIARKKYILSKAFSDEIKALGRSAAEGLDRYTITELAGASKDPISRFIRSARRTVETVLKPIPSGQEQLGIAMSRWDRWRRFSSGDIKEISRGERPIFLGKDVWESAKKYGPLETLFKGPIGAIAPGARIQTPGAVLTSGEHGGIFYGGTLFKLNKSGQPYEKIVGLRSGVMGSVGSRLEFIRTYGGEFGVWKNRKQYYRQVHAPSRNDIILEHKRALVESEISKYRVSPEVLTSAPTTPKNFFKLSEQLDDLYLRFEKGSKKTTRKLLAENKEVLDKRYNEVIEKLVKENANKTWVKRLYKAHRVGGMLGVGPQYAGYGAGYFSKKSVKLADALELGVIDPLTKRRYAAKNWRYVDEGMSLSGFWGDASKGKFYLATAAGHYKRNILGLIEGTFFKQMENWLGVGFSTAPNRMTEFVRNLIGSERGSWGDFFARRYFGGFGKLMTLGMGGFMTFKLVDYLARKATGGWGVTDVAGKMYTGAREFQQRVLNDAGVIGAARKTEQAFPGIVNSPAAKLARLSAPYWMTLAGSKMAGASGARLGLALGIATALVTWGDITQSPEELHRIYTGEQDIPVRKGRWWMFGKTPWGGGKIMYWRPHWYPLMRSKYKFKGQLWGSEEEELSTRGPLAPILSPILTGEMWDPYAWEKKHYSDRPYPLTGELFEPTMPFSWLGNMTIGRLIKPQRIMHPGYWGATQSEAGEDRTYIPGASSALGFSAYPRAGMTANADPRNNSWLLSEGIYTLTEQMGMRGFILGTINEQLTGRSNFLPDGPLIQSARRAYGYERGYWDLNIGDPAGVTEFFRRVLPHRRRGIEEYNPIPNEMPEWMPGEENYINFRTGDPYSKIEMGEARLPGAGYESLHRLHSGIPGVYDAVDRFMILSDVAPYSKEYNQYAYLAKAMTKRDKYWGGVVQRKDRQRSELSKEFEFLSLEPPSDMTGPMRAASSAYRRTIAALGPGGVGGLVEPFIGVAFLGSPMPFVESPISKFFPYRTATQTYRDFRLMGSDFSDWGHPIESFIKPYMNKVRSTMFGNFIPDDEQRRREYDEYFDKLSYLKYKRLAQMADDRDRSDLATKYRRMASTTMTGVNEAGSSFLLRTAIPKRERTFFEEFSGTTGTERDEILSMVPPQMAKIYRAQWAQRDTGQRARAMTDEERQAEVDSFFAGHYLPTEDWEGWNPDISMKDIKLKTVVNEGMDMHKFDLWESQQRSMARRPGVPMIEDIHQSQIMSPEELRVVLHNHVVSQGYSNATVNMTKTPSRENSLNIRVKVKKKDRKRRIEQYQDALV